MIKKIFSVKKIMLFVFLFVGCMLFVSCGEEKNDKIATSIDIVGNINSEYGLGVDIDLTNVFVKIGYSDNSVDKFSFTSSKVTADKFDTATIGEKEVEVSCEGLTTKIKYNVVEYILTLKFLDGTYEEATEKKVSAYNNFVDLKEIVPVSNDSTMQFAGWFYDEELTKRVETNIECEYIVNKDTVFYAGYDKNYDDIFKYEITDNGEVILTHYDYLSDLNFSDIIIPKTIKLYPVVSVDDNFIDIEAFSFLWWKDGLTFEEGSQVKYIGDYAFYGLSISSVNFPTTLEKIGNYTFYNCAITSITFPKNLRIIGDYAFADSYELMTIDFNDSDLVNIGNHAFDYLSKLVDVTLSDKVETIGSYAFANCSKLTEFYVSKSIISIGINTFASLPNLSRISVSEENKYFSSIDGNLYSKDKRVFYRYCYGKTEEEFSLPTTVKTIYESAFDIKNEISSLKKINLNEGLIEISSKAFANTTVEFVLPESLKTLALDAFYDWNGKEFFVNENNKYFKVLDSCLVSFDLKLYTQFLVDMKRKVSKYLILLK